MVNVWRCVGILLPVGAVALIGCLLVAPSVEVRPRARAAARRLEPQTFEGVTYTGGVDLEPTTPTTYVETNFCTDVQVESGNYSACYTAVHSLDAATIAQNIETFKKYPVMFQAAPTTADVQHVLWSKGEDACPPPCAGTYHDFQCFTVIATSPGACYTNTMWAMDTGLTTNPWLYADYTVDANTTFEEWQFVLQHMVGIDAGTGWQCPMPCTAAGTPWVATTATTTVSFSSTSIVYGTTTTQSPTAAGLPWWVWESIGLLLGMCLIGGILGFCLCCRQNEPKRATRSLVQQHALVEGQTSELSSSTYQTAAWHQQNSSYASIALQNSFDLPPLQSAYQPVDTPGPVSQQQAAALFDSLDANQDGYISRQEFERLVQ